jgi:hypothetical protein
VTAWALEGASEAGRQSKRAANRSDRTANQSGVVVGHRFSAAFAYFEYAFRSIEVARRGFVFNSFRARTVGAGDV